MEKAKFEKAAVVVKQLHMVNESLARINDAMKRDDENIVLAESGGTITFIIPLELTGDAQKVLDSAVIEIKNILLRDKAILEKEFKDL